MLILVTYDLNTETPDGRKRLQGVAKICMNHGQRVQNSVFECVVDVTQLAQLKILLSDIINKQKDSIRIYNLGNHYHAKVETMGLIRGINIEEELII